MPSVHPDRLEKLVTQVLEETRAFRQETKEEITSLRREMKENFASVRRDIGLLQTATLENATGLKEVRDDVKRVEGKLDTPISDHGARLDKLEGAAE